MRRLVFVLIAIALSSLASCGKKAGSGKPKVAVSIFPLYDVTKRIAGDRFDVILVLPPGKSEHGYDPTPKEIARLDGAKLGIAVGLDMDTWVENIMKNAGGVPKMLRVGEKVPTMPINVEPIEPEEHAEHHGEEHGDDHHDEGSAGSPHHEGSAGEAHEDHDEHEHKLGAPDPHVWMDPQRMHKIVTAIEVELTAIDPDGKATFERNAAVLHPELDKLDLELLMRSEAWTKRTIVTFHGSMSYFAKRYGLVIAAVVEPLAGKEPTATYLAEVLNAIKANRAAALFTEPQLDKGPGQTIANEAKIPLGELDPVGGVAGRDGYEALLLWNADQLDKVLK
jgi:zinc transport system substrate-binding protein